MAKLTLSQFQKKVERFAKNNPDAVKKALTTGAEVVRGEAAQNHMSGPTSGGGGFANESISVQSGNLRSSLTTRVKASAGGVSAKVATNVVYAGVHEYGFRNIPKRPYLRPSLEAKREEILDLMLRTIMQEYRRAS